MKRRVGERRKGVETEEWVEEKVKRKSGREEGRVGGVGKWGGKRKVLPPSPAFSSRPTAFCFRITEKFANSG